MPTLTLYPSLGTMTLSGVLHVGQSPTIAIVIAATESATFESGHSYILTMKRRGYLADDPYIRATLSVTADKTATAATDFNLGALYTALASRDYIYLQASVDDSADGVLGWTAEASAIKLANTPRRDGDVSPPATSPGASAAELAAVAASLQSEIDAIEGTVLSDDDPEPLGTVGPGTGAEGSRADHVHTLPTDIAANTLVRHTQGTDQGLDTGGANAVTAAEAKAGYTHSGVATGNPHQVTASEAGAYRQQTPSASEDKSGASVAPAFASSLTLQWALTANLTSFADATGLADGETGMVLVTIGAYSLPADPPSGAFKGAWTVTGTLARVIIERVGSVYLWSADSLTVVA